MSKTTDLAQIFGENDFHSEAMTVGPATYYGHWVQLFDDEGNVSGLGAKFVGLESSLGALAIGALVTIQSTVYKIKEINPQGPGMIELVLGDQT